MNKRDSNYLVIHPDREERLHILNDLARSVCEHNNQTRVSLFEGNLSSKEVYAHLMTKPFLEEEIVIWHGIKDLPSKIEMIIDSYLADPPPWGFFLMGASSLEDLKFLSHRKNVQVLDYSKEKYWEKRKRFEKSLLEFAQKEGKLLSPHALDALLERIGMDLPVLLQELRKIICFVGQKITIHDVDVIQISSSSGDDLWRLAENFAYGKLTTLPSLIEPSFLGQVRFCLQKGRKIVWALKNQSDMKSFKSIDIEKVKHLSPSYFDRVLGLLYETEILSKNSSLQFNFLISLLALRIKSV